MPEHVLDASATLALLLQETDGLEDLFGADRAVVSSVNLAEIFTRLVDEGWPQAAIQTGIGRLAIDIIDFDERQALDAGLLRAVARPIPGRPSLPRAGSTPGPTRLHRRPGLGRSRCRRRDSSPPLNPPPRTITPCQIQLPPS